MSIQSQVARPAGNPDWYPFVPMTVGAPEELLVDSMFR